MAKRKSEEYQETAEDRAWLKKAYEISRKNFTAADLQKFTVSEEELPFEDVIKEMEAIHRRVIKKKKA